MQESDPVQRTRVELFFRAEPEEKVRIFVEGDAKQRVKILEALAEHWEVVASDLAGAWPSICQAASNDSDSCVRYALAVNFDHLPNSIERRLASDRDLNVAWAPSVRLHRRLHKNPWLLAGTIFVTLVVAATLVNRFWAWFLADALGRAGPNYAQSFGVCLLVIAAHAASPRAWSADQFRFQVSGALSLLYSSVMWLAETPLEKRGSRTPWRVLGSRHIRDSQMAFLREVAAEEYNAFVTGKPGSPGDPCVPYDGVPTATGYVVQQILLPLVVLLGLGFLTHVLDGAINLF